MKTRSIHIHKRYVKSGMLSDSTDCAFSLQRICIMQYVRDVQNATGLMTCSRIILGVACKHLLFQ